MFILLFLSCHHQIMLLQMQIDTQSCGRWSTNIHRWIWWSSSWSSTSTSTSWCPGPGPGSGSGLSMPKEGLSVAVDCALKSQWCPAAFTHSRIVSLPDDPILNSQPQHSNIQHPRILKKVAVLVYPADSISIINTTSTPVPLWFSSSSAYHWSSSHAALPATPCSFLNCPICNSASLSAPWYYTVSALHTTLKPENSNSPFLTLGGCGWWCCGGANAADADAEEQWQTKWQEQFMLRMYSG